MTQFIADTVEFVSTEVGEDIAFRSGNNLVSETRAKARCASLKAWSNSTDKLSVDVDVLEHLIVAVRSDSRHRDGLPSADMPPFTNNEIASITVRTAQTKTNRGIPSPFLSGSRFLSLLRIAYAVSRAFMPSTAKQEFDARLADAIAIVLNKLKIHVLPWSPPPAEHQRDARCTNPSAFHWRMISNSDSTPSHSLRPSLSQPNAAFNGAQDAADTIRRVSSTASWSVLQVPLKDFETIFTKRSTPKDYNPSCVDVGTYKDRSHPGHYIWQQYAWLQEAFDMNNPAHRIILYAARIFVDLLPVVFVAQSNHFEDKYGESDPIRIIQEQELVELQGRGANSSPIMLMMFLGFALGVLEPESPLYKRLDKNANSLGEPWTNKHGEYSLDHHIII